MRNRVTHPSVSLPGQPGPTWLRRSSAAGLPLLSLALLAIGLSSCGGDDTTGPPVGDGAKIWRATANGVGSECGNLQDCLNTAADGDTIELEDGLYDSVGDTLAAGTCTALPQVTNGVCRKNVVVRGARGAQVVIDGRGEPGRVGLTVPADLTNVTIENLTFTNCWAGIGTAGGNVTIRNCVFTTGDHGLEAHETVLDLDNCTFEDHLQVAINLRNCSGSLRNLSVIASGAGLVSVGGRDLTVGNAQFGPFCKGGVTVTGSGEIALENCTIVDTAMLPGLSETAGILLLGNVSATIDRCIVAGNRGYGIRCATSGTVVVSCSDLFGNTVGPFGGCPDATGLRGNIAADPLFCGTYEYRLKPESPARLGDCGVMGAHADACGMSAVGSR